MISVLLKQDGFSWMSEQEQFVAFPESRALRSYISRPVWLVLSIVLREQGINFRNGLGVTAQMENMRKAHAGKRRDTRWPLKPSREHVRY